MNQIRIIQGRAGKILASSEETKMVVWNICSYQFTSMVGTTDSTNEKHKFYNSTVQVIYRG